MVERGRISLGKYIFFTIPSLAISDPLAADKTLEKKPQNVSPVKTNSGYGKLPDGILAKSPKKTVKINIENKG
jgi:hypothetical protein